MCTFSVKFLLILCAFTYIPFDNEVCIHTKKYMANG